MDVLGPMREGPGCKVAMELGKPHNPTMEELGAQIAWRVAGVGEGISSLRLFWMK